MSIGFVVMGRVMMSLRIVVMVMMLLGFVLRFGLICVRLLG